jgi:DNA-binding NtrC family response regulator
VIKVLVVDDSSVVRERLVGMLSTLRGIQQVDTATGAREARHAIQSTQPDVVVLDIHMPGGSGLQVLEALSARRPLVRTIVLTNDPAPQWRAASLRAGADFFFDKSAEFEQAVDVIIRLASDRQGGPNDSGSSPPSAPRSPRGNESILIVEDDEGVRAFAKHVLVARGYDVLVAASPSEAERLCAARSHGVDLLLTDYVLPGMTGRDLAASLRGRQIGMKVVYMSGYLDDVIGETARDPSVSFIAKPFTASGLVAAIRDVLDRV